MPAENLQIAGNRLTNEGAVHILRNVNHNLKVLNLSDNRLISGDIKFQQIKRPAKNLADNKYNLKYHFKKRS
jgi:hypothetical protein